MGAYWDSDDRAIKPGRPSDWPWEPPDTWVAAFAGFIFGAIAMTVVLSIWPLA